HHSAQAAPVAFGAIRGPAATGIPMLGGPSAMQRAGGWSTNNMSSDNLLLMGSSSGAKPPASLVAGVGPLKPDVRRISGLGDPTLQQPLLQRPKSSNHEADANPDWRIHRPLQGSAVGSPTAEHFAHQQLAIGAVGASRRQSNNLLTQQQATPRVSIDMEPKDFRWSSLTDSLEPFGAIGSDSNPPGLPHMFEANINRTSGIAARRSVSSRLSIPVKSPRDTLQSQQLGASLAQMSVSGIAGGQHLSSPLAATFAPQQQQNLAMPRGHYAQAAAAAPGPSFPMQYHQGFGVGHPSGMGTATAAPMPMPPPQPSRTLYGHSEPSTTPPGGDAGLKGQSEVVDLSLIRDIPAWLRSLRLHKYTECFIGMDWTSVVSLSDEQLQAKGVAALGARRKMLKVFEAVLKDM
ncbi:Flap-structured DNA-binding and RNA-binding protein, partial [Coemansia spiralis]